MRLESMKLLIWALRVIVVTLLAILLLTFGVIYIRRFIDEHSIAALIIGGFSFSAGLAFTAVLITRLFRK